MINGVCSAHTPPRSDVSLLDFCFICYSRHCLAAESLDCLSFCEFSLAFTLLASDSSPLQLFSYVLLAE